MIDQVLLSDTLQKINASLNKRFEKDADLYISKQDEYEIKKNLCNGAYGGIVNMTMAKGLSDDIVLKVILRNAGILDVANINDFKNSLKPIFEKADYRALSYMMEDVLSSNVYMQRKVRRILFKYYINGIPSTKKVQYWKQESLNLDGKERAILFNSILTKVNHKEPTKTYTFRLDFLNDAFVRYPEIMKDKEIFCRLKDSLSESDQVKLFKHLCSEMQSPSIEGESYNFILVDGYASYGEKAFNDAISQIKSSSPRNFKQYIKVINKLLRKEADKNTLVRMFDTIVKVYDSPYIKRHVQREISTKVWKVAKSIEALYGERKSKIDQLMKDIEQTDKNKYKSFADVLRDLQNNMKTKSIAYFWANIKSPNFEQSIEESFMGVSNGYFLSMKETYGYLFEHSEAKGGSKELKKMCEKIARAMYDFCEKGGKSQFYEALDRIWLDNVLKYKLNSPIIMDYMCDVHFDKAKEIE